MRIALSEDELKQAVIDYFTSRLVRPFKVYDVVIEDDEVALILEEQARK